MNERKARFSQPKRELYGLLRALKACQYWLIGIRNLVVETDAQYIKGMLSNPGMGPNATINRWIEDILMFHFTLRHVKGSTFPADGLSRRDAQPGDEVHPDLKDYELEDHGPLKFEVAEGTSTLPKEIDEFKNEIDSRGGYMYTLATSIDDFAVELEDARSREQELRDLYLAQEDTDETICQFLKATPLIPDLEYKFDPNKREDYPEKQRTSSGLAQDERLPHVRTWLRNVRYCLEGLNDKQYLTFKQYCRNFFLDKEGRLYRRSTEGDHRLVVDKEHRMYMMRSAHDSLGHRGFYATKSLLDQRFWWPELERDVSWYVKSCHLCQVRQKTMLRIPPSVTQTPSLFQKVHCDTMIMSPASNKCKYIVHARDSLSSWPEARALQNENARAIAIWFFEDVICRWGCPYEIVTDNGGPWVAVIQWLKDKYGITGIRITPYNSQANGKIERGHWDLRQALFKATSGNSRKWFYFLPHVLWADRITIKRGTGCSPYFMALGAHPIVPLDVVEATWLVKPPSGILSTADLIGLRAKALAKHAQHVMEMRQKVSKNKLDTVLRYQREHKATIVDYDFKPGRLVLMRNTRVEDSLDSKMEPRYLGPLVVIRRTKGGSYVLAELDGSIVGGTVAQFRVIPYHARHSVELPKKIHDLIDVSPQTLKELVDSDESVPTEYHYRTLGKKLYGVDRVRLQQSDTSGSDSDDSASEAEGYPQLNDNDSNSDEDDEVPITSRLRSSKTAIGDG
ncbi:uncharacterized protein ARMOST_16479 [Armillaria ostoyae]|uniref:Integrase catalytic domain-containing protein n=1 Tax=Armillaria ostoyae TaxID=47428 RepID=A0A284RWB8_ARMOS|nr:uncharacterized protein ARMOST_16479 [Armillaria ostoyae]